MKKCFKCHVAKPIDDFYKHPLMADGHLGKCKDCTKLDMRIDRLTKPRVRQYDRERATLPHRAALRRRVTKAWRAAHPGRQTAHSALSLAVRSGKMVRPETCELCGGKSTRIEGHHVDYSHPLAVIWVCKPCHAIADKVRRKTDAIISQLPF